MTPPPFKTDEYACAYEAGALEALDRITDRCPGLEDLTMKVAEHIRRVIDDMLGRDESDSERGA